MYLYISVYNGTYYYLDLWVHAMKAPLWHLERVASGTHNAQELLRLPLDTAKGCQCTIHHTRLQNMIQLSCCPPWAWASSHITLIRKPQGFLKVLANPCCQLGGQPAKDRVADPVHIFQRFWRDSYVRGESLVLQLESAGLKKVDIEAHTTSRLSVHPTICQPFWRSRKHGLIAVRTTKTYLGMISVFTRTYQYILVHTCMYWYALVCTGMYLLIGICWYILVYTSIYWYIPACTVLSDTELLWNQLVDTTRYKAVQWSTQKSCTPEWNRTRQYKAIQGLVPSCTFLYCLIQRYRTFGYFIVLPCIVLYPLTDFKEVLCLKAQYMLVYTSIYWYIPVYIYILNSKSMYRLPVHTGMYWVVLVCAGMYQSRFGFKNGANQVRTRDLLHTFRMLHRCTARVQTPTTWYVTCGKFVYIDLMFVFLALDDGSTAPVPLCPRPRPWHPFYRGSSQYGPGWKNEIKIIVAPSHLVRWMVRVSGLKLVCQAILEDSA